MKNQSREKLQQLEKNPQEYMARKFVKISKRKSFKRRREPKAYEVPHSNYFHEGRWKDEDLGWSGTDYGSEDYETDWDDYGTDWDYSIPTNSSNDGTSNLVKDLPDEIWERIFTNVSRDDLDLCTRMCHKWHRVIEGGSKRLTQRRVVYGRYCRDPNARFLLKVYSRRGKTIRVEDCPNRQNSGFYVFKNSILWCMDERVWNSEDIDRLEAYLKKLCDLGGERIPVKSFILHYHLRNIGQLERFHHFFPYYVNAEELVHIYGGDILNKKFWKCLEDFGPTTAVNIETSYYSTDVHRDAFCETIEPSKFFKEIDIHRCGFSEFNRIAEENGFEPVRQVLLQISPHERHKINVHRLDHPKLKWVLEATMTYKCALEWNKDKNQIFRYQYWRSRYNTLTLKIMEID
uniref:F-box domain-containing protein n=1 Tax=Acrobeloides nanus TaxID=290746 RepID=A0A914ENZ6_9BILA